MTDAIRTVLAQKNINPSLEDIHFYHSHGKPDSDGNYKRSWHVVLNNYIIANNEEAKAFAQKVKDCCLGYNFPYIDMAVYSSVQQFRTIFSTKFGKDRWKMRMREWLYKGKLIEQSKSYPEDNTVLVVAMEDSLLHYFNSGCRIPSYIEEKKKKFTLDNKPLNLTDAQYKMLEAIIDDSCGEIFTYNIEDSNERIISLKRNSAAHCDLCKRTHENENAYIIISPSGNVNYYCYRYQSENKENKYLTLGNLNLNIEQRKHEEKKEENKDEDEDEEEDDDEDEIINRPVGLVDPRKHIQIQIPKKEVQPKPIPEPKKFWEPTEKHQDKDSSGKYRMRQIYYQLLDVKGRQGFKAYVIPNIEQIVKELIEAINKGKKIAIPSSSKGFLNTLVKNNLFLEACKGRYLLINSDTPNKEYIISNINTILKDYQVLLYTPTIGAGIDIQEPFDQLFVYGIKRGSVTYRQLHQMIGRVRNVNDKKIMITIQNGGGGTGIPKHIPRTFDGVVDYINDRINREDKYIEDIGRDMDKKDFYTWVKKGMNKLKQFNSNDLSCKLYVYNLLEKFKTEQDMEVEMKNLLTKHGYEIIVEKSENPDSISLKEMKEEIKKAKMKVNVDDMNSFINAEIYEGDKLKEMASLTHSPSCDAIVKIAVRKSKFFEKFNPSGQELYRNKQKEFYELYSKRKSLFNLNLRCNFSDHDLLEHDLRS